MDDLVLSLLLTSVAPEIGGVLVRGEKGTAKSTAVRALAAILPAVAVVPGCRFSCDPARPDPNCPDGPHEAHGVGTQRDARLVELPVGATEDRLLGALDLERALAEGVRAYEPGLLAAAHRGVLYVDEVNLLHDHLVDVLLDAAAMGRAHVERESVSVTHASRFVLVGTMNPEEGELRPQLLDRFGLTVEVRASRDPDERAEVVRRRLAFDDDPAKFAAAWQQAETDLAERIVTARALLPAVVLPDAVLRQISGVCAAFEVDGMRADLVVARAARAHAAWAGRTVVTEDDVRVAARFALPHRRRRDPFDAPGMDDERLEQALEDSRPEDEPEPEPDGEGPPEGGGTPQPQDRGTSESPDDADVPQPAPAPGSGGTSQARAGATFRVKALKVPGLGQGASGRRSRALTSTGRTVGARSSGPRGALHLPATVAAAAPHQKARGRSGPGLQLRSGDLRTAVREGREGNLVLFCVDASGSMAARQRMAAVKGAVMSLLLDAYQRRDRVGLVTFRGAEAELALHPTGAVEAARHRLDGLRTGGRTPLYAGLREAHRIIGIERLRDARRRPLLVVVTDGRHTSGAAPWPVAARLAAEGVRSVVVDCEAGVVRLGMAAELAGHLNGELVRLDELRAEGLAGIVRERTGSGRREGRVA
ncbi:magnesium chelatase subunit D family protein [Spongisporangium articulatum]|uniref:Mg-protoporphyrin IX chelatase n=1 Tax=Spongisporangium articulatum TaxID=3362603 RepID=A0ABW8AKB7_9ACTN